MEKHEEAKQLKEQGKSYREIAQQLQVSKTTANRLVKQEAGKKSWREQHKSWLQPVWETIGGGRSGPVDAYGGIEEPTSQELLGLYGDTPYVCTKWSSDQVSAVPFRTYVKTLPGQSKPKCATSPVKKSLFNNLPNNTEVQEVVDHLYLDLLEHPNPYLSRQEMFRQIDIDLSLCGESFIRKVRSDDGLPEALDSLPPDKMKQAFSDAGDYIGWFYAPHTSPVFIDKDDIIWFKFVDPRERNGRGYGPLRGVFERVNLSKNELAYLASLYRNQARPDSAIGVKGISADGAERLQKEWNMRFKEGGMGGVVVIDSEETEVMPLNWNPKDIFSTDFYKYNRLYVFNAWGFNPGIFDSENANRAIADTAYYMSMKNGIVPRLRLIESAFNHYLAPEFDPRLFSLFDNPLPDDMSEKVALYSQAAVSGAVTRQDWRDLLELPEKDWAAEPTLPAGVLPISALQGTGAEHPDSDDLPNGLPIPSTEQQDVADTALNGAQIASLLEIITSITTGQTSRESGKVIMEVSFPSMRKEKINQIVDNLDIHPVTMPEVQTDSVEVPKKKEARKKYPSQKKLANALKQFFRQQESYVLEHGSQQKAFLKVKDWNKELDQLVTPIMRAYYDSAASNFVAELGMDTDLLEVVSPRIDEALKDWTMKFCQSTNDTTDQELDKAHDELKGQLKEGILNKESFQRELTNRVKTVYTRATTERAFLIAKTEANRAINQSQLLTAQVAEDNGTPVRKSIILSSNACPQCKAIKAHFSGRYELKTVFNPADNYGDGNPPFHPSCECSIRYEVL